MKTQLIQIQSDLAKAFEALQGIRRDNPIPSDDSKMTDEESSLQASLQLAETAAGNAAYHTKCAIGEVPD